MKTSEAIAQLATALAAAQGEIQNPKKDRTAKIKSSKGDYEYQYADLASVLDAVRPALSKHGIAIVQTPVVGEAHEYGKNADGNAIRVAPLTMTTRLLHKSGEWIEHELSYEIDPDDRLQALGSSITYLRRYALQAIIGIVAEEDDDGQGVREQTKQRQAQPTEQRSQPPEKRQPPPSAPVKAAAGASPRAAAAAAAVNDSAKQLADVTTEYGTLQTQAGKPVALKFWHAFPPDQRLGVFKRANVALKAISDRLGKAGAEPLLRDILTDRENPDDVAGILADLEKSAGTAPAVAGDDQPPH